MRRLEAELNDLRSQVVAPIPHVSALRAAQLQAGGRRSSSPIAPPPSPITVTAEVHREEPRPVLAEEPRPGTSRGSTATVRPADTLQKDFLKREYRLTTASRLDIWISNLGSECRAKGLPDVTDSGVDFEQVDPAIRSWVRDLINARIDESYQGSSLGSRSHMKRSVAL